MFGQVEGVHTGKGRNTQSDITFSLVVTVYNKEKSLCRCVDSILKQIYQNIQIILVDDGSTDRSGELCDSYLSEHICVVHQKNQGVVAARNNGLGQAVGRYVIFVDGDDYLDSGLLQKAAETLADNPQVEMLSWGCREVKETGELVACITLENRVFSNKCEAYENLNRYLMGYIWQWAFDRAWLIRNHLRFDGSFAILEDYDFILRAFACADTIASVDSVHYTYVRSDDLRSLSRRIPDNVFELHKRIGKEKQRLFSQIGYPRKEADAQMKLAAYGAIKNAIKEMFRAKRPLKLLRIWYVLHDRYVCDYFYNNDEYIPINPGEKKRFDAVLRRDYLEIYRLFRLYEKDKQQRGAF